MSNYKKNWASALLLSTSVLLSAGIILDNPNVNIAKAIENVGKNGVITVDESKGTKTYFEYVNGYQYNKGYGGFHDHKHRFSF